MEFTDKITTDNFVPDAGYVLIDPIEKVEKSTMMKIPDPVSKEYRGIVLSVGDPRMTDYGEMLPCPHKKGDLVEYSIAGCEERKMKHNGELNHRVILAPFGRILGGYK